MGGRWEEFLSVLTTKESGGAFIKGDEQWQHLSTAVRKLITWAPADRRSQACKGAPLSCLFKTRAMRVQGPGDGSGLSSEKTHHVGQTLRHTHTHTPPGIYTLLSEPAESHETQRDPDTCVNVHDGLTPGANCVSSGEHSGICS